MKSWLLVSAAIAAVAAMPATAQAQDGGQSASQAKSDDSALGEIVVTAERREENLQDVPIAATALSGDELSDKGVARLDDLQRAAPSLTVTDAGLTQSVNIRGVGIASGSPAVANGVAVYINGVFQPPILTTSSFYDVGNVEVLRGPQGTLVGSNSTGGAIFLNTARAEFGKIGGFAQASYGNYDSVTLQGALNLPVADNLAVRFAGNYKNHDSYFTDIGPHHNEPDSLDEKAGRVTVRWQPGNLSVTAHAELTEKNTGGYAFRPMVGTPYAAGRTNDPRTLDYSAVTADVERAFLTDLEARYDFGFATLRYQAGYTNKRTHILWDNDATELPPPAGMDQYVQEKEWVQEVNLISPTDGSINWILGGYYQHNDIYVNISSTSGSPVDPTHILIYDYKTTLGAFAQLGFKLSDQLELQVGGRYSHYAVTQKGNVAIGYGTAFGPNGLTVADLANDHQDGRATGKVSLNYQPNSDTLFYAFVSRGYKPGGANSATSEFDPETVWDYELGWKQSFMGNHLRTQIGAFYMDYSNFQFDRLDTTTGQSGVANIGKSTIYGGELQVQARFGGLNLDGGIAYVHSKLDGFTAVNTRLIPPGTTLGPQCVTTTPTPTPTGCIDYTGLHYIQSAGGGPNLLSPRWSFNAGASYRIDLGGASLTPRIDYSFVGKQYASFFYSPQFDLLKSRGLVSAQLTFETGDWMIEAYGRNLANKTYVSGIAGNNEFYGAPREYGVRASVRF